MGYLPPVQYTQYQEYQNRIKSVKSSYSRTVRIDKLNRIYLSQPDPQLNKKVPARLKHRKHPEKSAEKVYADITGIGGNFNDRI